ncbi:MAG: hypothetical protein IGS03_18985 [Candidatus Sericytochromatia bacterium]|nr:hypothetical protein [Candidatus Sericytochromatia bacterium]
MPLSVQTHSALLQLDSNRDRQLSTKELQQIDSNRDGFIGWEEGEKAGLNDADRLLINPRYRGKIQDVNAIVFSRQALDALQLASPLNANFDIIDRNRDGKLAKSELASALGNPSFDSNNAAAIATAYKRYDDLVALQADRGLTRKLPQHQLLDKLPLQRYSEGGISRNDLSALLDAADSGDARVSEAMGRFSISTYGPRSATRELFPKGLESIRPDHIEQGELGDCYFLAAVASLADTPSGKRQIFNMIQPHSDGRFTVTFPGKEPVTFHGPTDSELGLYSTSGRDGLWLAVLEKAYAIQRNDNAWLIQRSNPYDKIGNGDTLSEGIRAATGKSTRNDILKATPLRTLRLNLRIALQQQRVVTAAVMNQLNPFSDNDRTANGLPRGHAYSILDYDAASDQITVRNPWGSTEVVDENGRVRDGVNDGTFKMSLEEFKQSFDLVTYEAGH